MTPLYLSRLLIDPADPAARRDLGDIYELHRTVMSGFPERLSDDERVLFRLDEDRAGRPSLLVQSRNAPDWGRLPPGWLAADPFDPAPNPAVKRVEPALERGRVLRFRLRANPTVKLRRDDRLSNRVPLATAAQQADWLARQAARHGFELLRVDLAGSQVDASSSQADNGRRAAKASPLKVVAVTYEGLLRVTDGERLAAAVASGIGPAKAFGCGLLSLAPG